MKDLHIGGAIYVLSEAAVAGVSYAFRSYVSAKIFEASIVGTGNIDAAIEGSVSGDHWTQVGTMVLNDVTTPFVNVYDNAVYALYRIKINAIDPTAKLTVMACA